MGSVLLRTRSRRVALAFRIACLSLVGLTYLSFSLLSVSRHRHENQRELSASSESFGRHLLAVNSTREANGTEEINCTSPAINEFPADGFSKEERQHGWIILHVILACYAFIFLAVVCDDYFVPCIKKLCDVLHLKEDIAGATFMATASSSAEIFINTIGTFITQGDIGVGTIVGSAVFNILAVPACCGFFANMVLDLEWYPITRDSLVYGCSVVLLIAVLQDGKVYYYEALVLVLLYIIYVLIMVFNDRIRRTIERVVVKLHCRKRHYQELKAESQPLLLQRNGKPHDYTNGEVYNMEPTLKDIQDLEVSTNIWEWPEEESKKAKCWWLLTWPISFVLYLTTPTAKNHPKMYVITFSMCVFWIGSVSYVIAWLITIIGDTLEIPDSVMGLTFLAAGTSVPEAVSSVLVTNQGHGSMGISSSIGSNTFDILLCLGLPWLIKSAFYPKTPDEYSITINSQGINYSAACLLTTLILLYVSICFNKFKLDWKIGLTCMMMYVGFLVFASLVELNVFFPVNLPSCAS